MKELRNPLSSVDTASDWFSDESSPILIEPHRHLGDETQWRSLRVFKIIYGHVRAIVFLQQHLRFLTSFPRHTNYLIWKTQTFTSAIWIVLHAWVKGTQSDRWLQLNTRIFETSTMNKLLLKYLKSVQLNFWQTYFAEVYFKIRRKYLKK